MQRFCVQHALLFLAMMMPVTVLLGIKLPGMLSPTKTRVAYLASGPTGAMNLWVQSIKSGRSRCVTHANGAGVLEFFWGNDGRNIMYSCYERGCVHVHCLEIATNRDIDCTPSN